MKKVLVAIAIIVAFSTHVFAQKDTGFGGQVELGYGFGLGDGKLNVFQISAMPGYHFCPYVFAGVGIGFNSYSLDGGSMSTFPIFAHATVNLTSGKAFTPFIAAKVGYGIGSKSTSVSESGLRLDAKVKSGLYVAPSFGVKYRLNEGNALSLALFYDVMSFKGTLSGSYESENASVSETENNSALGIRLGWEF